MSKPSYISRKKSGKRRFYRRISFWFICFLFLGIVGIVGLMVANKLADPYRERAKTYDLDRINELEIPSLILDRNGKEIGRIFVQNRSVISIDEVPDLFIDALRAGEDSRFLSHSGVDYIGIARAVILNYKAGQTTQGASTITQQLARNAYPLKQEALARGEGGIERKLVEAFLAIRIEDRYHKREILEFYLNRIYFGSGFYGVRSASLGYFGKEPKELSLIECATIVGLIKNPTNHSPLNNITASRKARNMVLTRMKDEGMITSSECASAQLKILRTNSKPLRRGTTHLYERIADGVAKSLGVDALAAGGYTIHTTISSEIQNAAERAISLELDEAEAHPLYTRKKYKNRMSGDVDFLQGSLFMMDHYTGEVLAHVGGRDYSQVPFDFIEMGRRPLGTAFFPFLYATALAHQHTPAYTVIDEPMDNRAVMVGGREGILGEWGMEVASPKYEGKISLRRAFAQSKIASTVRLANETGIQRILDAAVEFGFPLQDASPLPRVSVGWESASLKEAVTAISTFPLKGRRGPKQFTYIDRIQNASGKIVYRRKSIANPVGRLLDEAVSWQIHHMMAGNFLEGSARGLAEQLLEKPFPGAGKGGSTHDFADTWFLGYNGRVSCGVWTGFLQGNNEPIYPGAFSRDISMPIWKAAMNAAAPAFGGRVIEMPDSLVGVKICSVSGQRSTQFCHEMTEDLATGGVRSKSTEVVEYFRKGQENLAFCTHHSGAETDAQSINLSIDSLPALDTLPVLPKAPVLIGDDPFHTVLPSYTAVGVNTGFIRRSTNVLDSLDLGDFDEPIRIKRPERLEILPD